MSQHQSPERRLSGTPMRRPLLTHRLIQTIAWTFAEGSMQRRREKSCGLRFPEDFDDTMSIFVHVPRTAGTSIAMALYGREVKHHSWSQWLDINPRKCRDYYSFAVVRDPIGRFLSAYEFLKGGGMNPVDQKFAADVLAGCADAEQFIRSMMDLKTQKKILGYWHFRPQSAFLDGSPDAPAIKTLIPFDHVVTGFAKVARALGKVVPLPHLNAVNSMPHHPLSTNAIEILQRLYRRDNELLQVAHEQAKW